MSAHGKRQAEVVISTVATSDEEFAAHLAKPGLRAKFAGPCEPMAPLFKRLKLDFGDVTFVQAISDNIAALAGFRGQSCPTFLFFYNGHLVKMVKGANAPLISRVVAEQMDLTKNNQPHPRLPLDDTTRPLANVLSTQSEIDTEHAEVGAVPAAPIASTAAGSFSNTSLTTSNGAVDAAAGTTATAAPAAESSDSNGVADATTDEGAKPPSEQDRTLAIIKPDCVRSSVIEEVMSILHRNRIDVINKKKVWLTKEGATELFKHKSDNEFFTNLVDFMTSSPIIVFELGKTDVISLWRQIIGPTDPKFAKHDSPKTLRAMYGTDIMINGFHGSDGPVSSARERAIFFPPSNPDAAGENPFFSEIALDINAYLSTSASLPLKTLAIIKPGVSEKAVDEIISRIVSCGIVVYKRENGMISVEQARMLAEAVWDDDEAKCDAAVEYLTSGPVISMVLKGEDVIKIWLEIVGPEDPDVAKTSAPMSIRAQYGTDDIRNAVHASATADDALFEIQGLFANQLAVKGGSLTHLFESRRQSLAALSSSRRASISNKNNLDGDETMGPLKRSQSHHASSGQLGLRRQSISKSNHKSFAQLHGETLSEGTGLENTGAKRQRTLALIKPDVYPAKKDDILQMMLDNGGFTIVAQKEVQWTSDDARAFYKEHEGKPFYEDLVRWMSSAPIYAIVLEKEDGIKAWRALAGPTNSIKAREESPSSIRALFGTDGSENAVHGSDSPASAVREIQLVFGGEVEPQSATQAAAAEKSIERTLALIKPDVYPAKKDEIVTLIKEAGFIIVKEQEVQFDTDKASEFYQEHNGKGFYDELTGWMSSTPIYALVLEKKGAIADWRALAGPTNSNKARETAPHSIRALLGTDGSQNAVHGSDSSASATREIKLVFGEAYATPGAPVSENGAVHTSKPATPKRSGSKDELINPASQPTKSGPSSRPGSQPLSKNASKEQIASL